jgi:hypothetical protein
MSNESSSRIYTDMPVEHLFTYEVTLDQRKIDCGPSGTKIHTLVTEGTFEGERLRGEIIPNHSFETADVRSDGFITGDLRLWLRTDDGADILMTYIATAVYIEGGMSVRNYPFFETGAEKYQWINKVQAVTLYDVHDGVLSPIDVYELPKPSWYGK